MSSNISQIYLANPSTNVTSGALIYLGITPFGIANDSAITWSDMMGSIVKTGTILTGSWNASLITGTYGGTGVNNGASLITIGGNLTFSGAFAFTGTLTATTNVTFPTSGTLATTAQIPTPAAMTQVSDTNVTLTLGGSPATSLLQATSLTIGWSGTLALARGGLAANLTASNGGIFYSTATSGAILAGTATANQILLSGSSSAPSWSTATYPATTTINQLLYSSATNVISGVTAQSSAILLSNASSTPVWSSALTNGQIIIGSTGATPVAATITAGGGINITNAAGAITISATASGLSWSTIAGTLQAAVVDSAYVVGNAGLTTITLPTTAPLGSSIAVEGLGAGGWVLAAGAGQTIKIGLNTTTVAGSLASTAPNDNVYVVCIVPNTTWRVQTTNSNGLTIA